ncbi:MAG: multifunctional 2-oxoglutarate metabolism enzyme, partial [Pseudonocardiales bacterium]|nr:multifunctional 2-oxoglutarate metabolism enzyme [Pseudonocardiales bacterium]
MTTDQSTGSESTPTPGDFGTNEWLVEDMYERYLTDPGSVDEAWHDFFADYRPGPGSGAPRNGTANPPAAAAPTTPSPAAPAPTDTGTPPPSPGTQPSATPQAKATPEQADAPSAEPKPSKPAAKSPTPGATTLRGAASRVVLNMQTSLSVPTATSVRAVPAKLMADNRVVINNHLRRSRGGKVSFTHIVGYAIVRALHDFPEMNNYFAEIEGKPSLVTPEHVNLGIAIDLVGKDNSRSLVVANIKGAETMDFAGFWNAYEDIIRRARAGKLGADDFAGTTLSLTNPGTIGTNHSVPRLMAGQGTIVGVGAMEYPAEFSGMSDEKLSERAISKIMTLTSTYDHRIIQGAQSGEFLRRIHQLLLADDFYDQIFAALRIPYEPIRWMVDRDVSHEGQIDKNARVIELINSYRARGHLMADTDPL